MIFHTVNLPSILLILSEGWRNIFRWRYIPRARTREPVEMKSWGRGIFATRALATRAYGLVRCRLKFGSVSVSSLPCVLMFHAVNGLQCCPAPYPHHTRLSSCKGTQNVI